VTEWEARSCLPLTPSSPVSRPGAGCTPALNGHPHSIHALLGARISGTLVVNVLTALPRAQLAVPIRDARHPDVGCGQGAISRTLAALVPASLVALDLSPVSLLQRAQDSTVVGGATVTPKMRA
jgi:2-polyprenyl-3-methyl-5-hydroxy-6-metoxy-1,4-benzoquinol methylase